MSPATNPLALDPLGPMGLDPFVGGISPTSARLGLDPFSPVSETWDPTPQAPTYDQAPAGRKATP
jgi:hypothetical protein